MTVIGKIFVLVNLVVSLVVAALIIMVFATRTNWADAYKKLEDRYKVARAAADGYGEDVRRAQNEATKRIEDANQKVITAEANLKAANDKIAQVSQERDNREKERNDAQRVVVQLQTDISRREGEVKLLEKSVEDRDAQNIALAKNVALEHQAAVTAQIQVNSLKERNTNLLAMVQELEKKEKARLASGGLPGPGGTFVQGPNPPPEQVEGLITRVDRSQGLVALSIGSDSGLQKGHTLEVYRINQNAPEQSKYLGTIKITDVRAKEAVAQPLQARGQLQEGDRVSAKLGGG